MLSMMDDCRCLGEDWVALVLLFGVNLDVQGFMYGNNEGMSHGLDV